MPEIPKVDPEDRKIANLYMSWTIKTHTDDILEELEQLTDVALTGEADFSRIGAMLIFIDGLSLTVPGRPHLPLYPLFKPLELRYTYLLEKMRKIAAEEVAHAQQYTSVVLPILKDADFSNDQKKEVVEDFMKYLAEVQSKSDQLEDDFDTLRRQLDDFGKLLEKFALEIGAELAQKIREVQNEIDQLMREIQKFQKKARDDLPSPENTSKMLLGFGAMSTAMAGSAGYQVAAVAAAKTALAGAATTGSAACVGALGAALPVAMVVLAGWGIWAAVKSAQVLAELAQIAALSAELVVNQLRLVDLLRQTVTLGAVQTLARNAITSVATASMKVGNLVRVWSIVSHDAKAMLHLLDAGATTQEIIDNALLAESWYELLVELLRRVSTKLVPRVEPPQVGPQASKTRAVTSLQRLLEHFSCQGGTSHFLPQSRPMPPVASTVTPHELPMNQFQREYDMFFDGSTYIDEDDLTEDQRAMMETMTGMRHPQPFLFDAGTGTTLGDVGVATLTFGRISRSVARFAKSGAVRTSLQHARNLTAFFGPRFNELTGPPEVKKELFKEILKGALSLPSIPPNPEHPTPATHQNIVWLLMWRRHFFEWIVRGGLWNPWRIWCHPLWSNPILFEHMQHLLGLLLNDMHAAFEKWYAEHRKGRDDKDKEESDGGDDEKPKPTNTTLMTVYEDKFELIDQIYRLNLLQLGILTADTKLSIDGNLFNTLVERMVETYRLGRNEGHDERTALSAVYFYAARCPTFGRLILALALQNALVRIFNSDKS